MPTAGLCGKRNVFLIILFVLEQYALEQGLIPRENGERDIKDLQKTASGGGTFCYTLLITSALMPGGTAGQH